MTPAMDHDGSTAPPDPSANEDERAAARFQEYYRDPWPPRPPAPLAARVGSWTLLGAVDLVGLACVVISWMSWLPDPGRLDADGRLTVGLLALFAFGFAIVSALLTTIAVLVRWVNRRWFAAPLLIVLIAIPSYLVA